MHAPCSRPFRNGVVRGGSIALEARDALILALEDMLRVQDALMPGVRYIAVQDYALLNEAPMRARAALALAKGEQ